MAVYAAIHGSSSAAAFALLVAGAAGLAWLRPELGRGLLWGLVLGAQIWSAWSAWTHAEMLLDSTSSYLPLLSVAALLLDSVVLGAVNLLLTLGNLACLGTRLPALSPAAANLLSDRVLGSLAYFGLGLLALRSLEHIRGQIEHGRQRLRRRVEDVELLAQTLFTDLHRMTQALDLLLLDWPASADAIGGECANASQSLVAARGLLPAGAEDAEAPAMAEWEAFRRRIFRGFLHLLIPLGLVDLAVTLRKGGPVASSLWVSLSLWTSLALQRWRPGWSVAIRRACIGAFLLGVASAVLWWGFSSPAPALHLLPALAFFAVCLDGLTAALLVCAADFLFIGFSSLGGAFDGPGRAAQALDLGLAQLAVLGGVLQAYQLTRGMLRQLRREESELRLVLLRRRRLASTLFHDIRNLLTCLTLLAQAQTQNLGQPGDGERARSLTARIRALIQWAQRLHQSRDQDLDHGGDGQELRSLVEGLKDSFGPVIQAKGLRLDLEEGGPLRVPGAPELLRDVLMGNLLSNALKFAPPGSAVAIGGRLERGELRLWVRDQGPGFSDRRLDELALGPAARPAQGSGGETGMGIGLSLVRGYLEQMGGRLEMGNAPGGGGLCALVLPAA